VAKTLFWGSTLNGGVVPASKGRERKILAWGEKEVYAPGKKKSSRCRDCQPDGEKRSAPCLWENFGLSGGKKRNSRLELKVSVLLTPGGGGQKSEERDQHNNERGFGTFITRLLNTLNAGKRKER